MHWDRGTTASNVLARARDLTASGQLQSARRLLEEHADGPECLHLLAKLLNATGAKSQAVETMTRALRVDPELENGVTELGVMLLETGAVEEAIVQFQQAVGCDPRNRMARFNLAWSLRHLGRLPEAAANYRAIVEADSSDVQAQFNLGNILLELEKHAEAILAYEQALRLAPDDVSVLLNFGIALQGDGQLDRAEEVLRRASALRPERADLSAALGNVLSTQGKFTDGIQMLRRAFAAEPRNGKIVCNLATALTESGSRDEAQTLLEKALSGNVDMRSEVLNRLGLVHLSTGQAHKAEAVLREAVSLAPTLEAAHNNLGVTLCRLGKMADGIAALRTAHDLAPTNPSIHSALIFALGHSGITSDEEIWQAARSFGEIQEALAGPPPPLPRMTPLAGRRLRIGYVSPDFRNHAVAMMVEPVLLAHDRQQVEVFCYYTGKVEDEVTRRFKAMAAHWRHICGLSAKAAAALIRQDSIDVLVDLAGHTAGNGLPIFAHKPAHVQATWLGAPGTTGLTRIDVRLGEAVDSTQTVLHSTERLIPLTSFPTFREPAGAPEVGPPPCFGNGVLTFGSANRLSKISAEVLDAWTSILAHAPDSRLVIMCEGDDQFGAVGNFRRAAASLGIAPDRIRLEAERPYGAFLSFLNEIDIGLDTFPYCGGSTTLSCAWMGVPVVTLAADKMRGGTSAAIARTLGVPEMIASDIDDYVKRAVGLANNRDQILRLRAQLRARMLCSPIMDPTAMAKALESVLVQLVSAN